MEWDKILFFILSSSRHHHDGKYWSRDCKCDPEGWHRSTVSAFFFTHQGPTTLRFAVRLALGRVRLLPPFFRMNIEARIECSVRSVCLSPSQTCCCSGW